MKDYYGLLGIRHFTSNQDEIKAAYREQIRFFHPDAGNVPEEIALQFSQDLNEIYAVLSDPEAKANYDEMLAQELLAKRASVGHQSAHYDAPQQDEVPSPAAPRTSVRKPTIFRADYIFGALLIIAIIGGMILPSLKDGHDPVASQSSSENTVSSTVPDNSGSLYKPDPIYTMKKPGFKAVAVYNGQIFLNPSDDRVAPLTVDTSGEGGYYIYLDSNSGRNDMAFYVAGGQSLDILVPLEVYDIYYATGDYWRGEDYLFGPKTAYYHCDDKFKFSAENGKYLGWTLTLYPVADGNLDTDPISAADFPG